MPSKGIQCYTYISVPGAEVVYTVPGDTKRYSDLGKWFNDDIEVDGSKVKFGASGRFNFNVTFNGQNITSQWVNVKPWGGTVEGGTMETMAGQHAVVTNDLVVSYGFYVAGLGTAGLPKRCQCWVTVTANHSSWMAVVAPAGSSQSKKTFKNMVLPAAHDIGMNSMDSANLMLQFAGVEFVDAITKNNKTFDSTANAAKGGPIALFAPNIISGLAITQKDTLQTILNHGARYFEFRPAFLHSAIRAHAGEMKNKIFFQHGPIPGMLYEQMLSDTIAFLTQNPLEIVVINIRWDGVPNECEKPKEPDLRDMASAALKKATNDSIVAGGKADMINSTIEQIRADRKRLIILYDREVNVYSTYTDGGYATLDGEGIIKEFEKINESTQDGRDLMNLQCQATATNIRDVVVNSVMTANASNSCLLATKPVCTWKTLPWIQQHALERLKKEGVIVIMNDFLDGATAEVAIQLSKQRLG